jgi:hypothetical protein
MISMAVLTPFFDVVAGVAILAGRSSLLDKGVFKTANTNFTVRHLLALGFIGYGGWNLWKIERAQDKLKKTLDAESFSADSFENLPHAYPELREYVLTNEESMEFWELIEARMRAAKEEGLEDWENDSNAHLLSGHIQELIWEHDDFDAESFGAEPSYRGSGDLYDCGCAVDDYEDDWNISCKSCGYVSCLDCHYVDSTDVNPQNWKCYEGYGCNKGAESFSADTIKTGVICGDNGCKGELLETEYGKASKVHCDKCDYSEIMEWNAESFSAESGDKPSCGHADCMDFGMDGWLSDRAIVFRYYTQWFNGVGQDEFFAYTGAWKPILALNALSPEDMKDIANTERDVVGCYRGGFNAESFGADSSVYVGSKDYSNEIVEKLNPILRNKIGKTFVIMNTDDDSWMFRLTDVDEKLDDDFIEYDWEKEVYAPHKNNGKYVGFDWKEQGFNCFHSPRNLYGFNIPLANAGYEMKRMDKIDPSEYKLVKFENLDAESFGAEDMITITGIDWETDGEDIDLPTTMKVPADLEEDEIADYLSDQKGWLVNGFVMGAESFNAEHPDTGEILACPHCEQEVDWLETKASITVHCPHCSTQIGSDDGHYMNDIGGKWGTDDSELYEIETKIEQERDRMSFGKSAESFGADSSVYVGSKDYSNEIVEKLNPILRNKIGKTFVIMNTDDDSWMFRLTDVDEKLDDDFIEYDWEKEVYAPHKNNGKYVGFDWKEQGFNCFHSPRNLYGFNIPLANAGYEMKRMDKIDPSEYKLVKFENLDAESFGAELQGQSYMMINEDDGGTTVIDVDVDDDGGLWVVVSDGEGTEYGALNFDKNRLPIGISLSNDTKDWTRIYRISDLGKDYGHEIVRLHAESFEHDAASCNHPDEVDCMGCGKVLCWDCTGVQEYTERWTDKHGTFTNELELCEKCFDHKEKYGVESFKYQNASGCFCCGMNKKNLTDDGYCESCVTWIGSRMPPL